MSSPESENPASPTEPSKVEFSLENVPTTRGDGPSSSPGPGAVQALELMDRYECAACGYIYEPVKGDERSQTPAGIAFEDLALNWRCPVCSAPKKRFQNIGPKGTASGFKQNSGYGFGVNTLSQGQKSLLIFGSLFLAFLFFLSLYGLQ